MNKKEHWESVFSQKQQTEVSWHQPVPKSSIDFFESNSVPKDATIIDVGSGDSYFIDYLVNNGYQNVYALDISEHALNRLKIRLGDKANRVNWIVSDVLDFKAPVTFDYWHDRAAFHFLSDSNDVDKYVSITTNYIKPNGKMMLATFSDSGPLKCSGINVKQYSKDELANQFSNTFEKIKCVDEVHPTPFNTTQNFTYCSFKKK
ncbi:MAG: class I SAM-dependent methyltransferase [Bacteroidetes bacterium]|jgi:2-polyprenyl-3-methyl-5-hydroxy-6-metoxy-1,4-benzoquinol methylase|nr:class I SAM-dependent methyltransferase [Bacteroidota bacterium]MBK8366880.1 class I SAM-dependent methyltransferase [Bacteroidota bacterium]